MFIIVLLKKSEYVMAYKQSRRREDDIAIVNSCFRVLLNETNVIKDCHLVFGGMSFKTLAAGKTEQALIGK